MTNEFIFKHRPDQRLKIREREKKMSRRKMNEIVSFLVSFIIVVLTDFST